MLFWKITDPQHHSQHCHSSWQPQNGTNILIPLFRQDYHSIDNSKYINTPKIMRFRGIIDVPICLVFNFLNLELCAEVLSTTVKNKTMLSSPYGNPESFKALISGAKASKSRASNKINYKIMEVNNPAGRRTKSVKSASFLPVFQRHHLFGLDFIFSFNH